MNKQGPSRKGFTLVELLVVIAVIGILIALLIPAVQQVRAAARKVECQNNLKQIGVALHHHLDVYKKFPCGATDTDEEKTPVGYGVSWHLRILPFYEQNSTFTGYNFHNGSPGPGWDTQNLDWLHNKNITTLTCPSSPMDWYPQRLELLTNWRLVRPMYAGIAGSDIHHTAVPAGSMWPGGTRSRGGILIPQRQLSETSIHDGLSNTMMVGETSDWLVESDGKLHPGSTDHEHGISLGWADWGWRAHLITTVKHRVNDKAWENSGVHASAWGGMYSHGAPNMPIQSAHSVGANVLLADGSVHLLTQSTDLPVLKHLADRNDGEYVNPFD